MFRKSGYDQPFWYLFDAKYRFDETEGGAGETTYDAPQDAIGQLHRYRDAILHSAPSDRLTYRAAIKSLGGIILYPFPGEERDFEANPYYQSIEQVNIGALPFLPSKTQLVERFLDELLGASPEQHLERVVDYDRRDYEKYFGKFEDTLLIGLLKETDQVARRSFVERTKRYAIPAGSNDGLRKYRAKELVLYEGGRKRWTGHYRIEDMDLWSERQLRAAGATWNLSSPHYLVYRLQLIRRLDRTIPLPLRAGYRYTNPGAFALFLEEQDPQVLYLNSFPALRLYRELRARGFPFRIRPLRGRPRSVAPGVEPIQLDVVGVGAVEVRSEDGDRPYQLTDGRNLDLEALLLEGFR